jgi:hypothetical protein
MTVSLDSGAYAPVNSTTNAAGQASGYISIGASKANRTITATYSLGGLSGTASLTVVGSAISITALPTSPTPGSTVNLTVKATDTNGTTIPFADITLGGSLGFTQVVNTGSTGLGSASITAPIAANTYTITAAGLGVTQTKTVSVAAAGVTVVPDAVGVVTSASLAITPNTIFPNTSGSSTNRANLRAVFLDATNTPIPNVRARFEITGTGLGNGEYISTGTNTVFSDTAGVGNADYVAGTRSSPTDGVSIKVCYGMTDASIANSLCPSSVTSTLTVAGQPLSISIGDNNKLTPGNGGLTYIKQFDIAVADASGLAVSNALVSASVDITQFGKGIFTSAYIYPTGVTSPPDRTADPLLDVTLAPNNGASGTRVWCPNEDANRNGFLDSGEDTNTDGVLTPRKAEIVLSFVTTNQTNNSGRLLLQVEYAQNVATWLAYTIKVSTSVLGSEGTAAKAYITDYLKDDLTNGSFLTPPYGSGACNVKQ